MSYDTKFIGTVIQWKDSTSSTGSRKTILSEDILSAYKSISINPSSLDPKVKPSDNKAYISINYISTLDGKDKIAQFNTWSDDILGWTGESSEDFAKFMQSYVYADAYTAGTVLEYSPIDEPIGDASNLIDGDKTTYSTIGTNGVRYIMHDFGGNLDNAQPINRIEWIVDSDIEKNYTVEGWNGTEWIVLYYGKSYPNENKKYKLIYNQSQVIYAVRLYYRGDYKTNSPAVNVKITSNDTGSGTSAYQISAYPDFRDASSRPGADPDGWISTINGTTDIDWDLINDIDYWQLSWLPSEVITDLHKYNDRLFISCESGNIYTSSDPISGIFELVVTLASKINVLYSNNDYIYAGCQNGIIQWSTNGDSWSEFATIDFSLIDLYLTYDGILSFETYGNKIYVGTDLNRLYSFKYDDGTISYDPKVFSDRYIYSLKNYNNYLWITVGSSGKIYKYDGSTYSFILNTEITEWGGVTKYNQDNNLYLYGDLGRIYKYSNSNISVFYDSSANKITDSIDAVSEGPIITYGAEYGTGLLYPGNYIYTITYIDYYDNESLIGQMFNSEVVSNTRASIKLQWKKIDKAKYYNIYRTIKNNQSEAFLRLIASGINQFEDDENLIERGYYIDDGSVSASATQIPSTSNSKIWFSTDNDKLYIYDTNSISTIDGAGYKYIDKIINFDSSIFISTRSSTSSNSRLYKFIGDTIDSGIKKIYIKTKDNQDNESDIKYDEIYLDVLYNNSIIEVDNNSNVIDIYSSDSKIISAKKDFYRSGIYTSEPFYAETLSRWDVLRYMIYLPEGTEFEVYARASEDFDLLTSEPWFGPGGEINDDTNDYYYDYEGDNNYSSEYDIYPDQPKNITGDFDISSLTGKWVQFKVVLKTYTDNVTPFVYSILLKYFSVNSVYFFTKLFSIEEFANNENLLNGDEITIKRGILTYNGSIPLGGDIKFGIAIKDSNNWQDYQEISPKKVFEMETVSNEFKLGIMLISTDSDVALVHEFGLMFDIGDNFIQANKNLYDSTPYII